MWLSFFSHRIPTALPGAALAFRTQGRRFRGSRELRAIRPGGTRAPRRQAEQAWRLSWSASSQADRSSNKVKHPEVTAQRAVEPTCGTAAGMRTANCSFACSTKPPRRAGISVASLLRPAAVYQQRNSSHEAPHRWSQLPLTISAREGSVN